MSPADSVAHQGSGDAALAGAHLVSAAAVVAGGRVLRPGWVAVREALVAAVGEGVPPRPADEHLTEATLVPGFVDIHVHGGDGAAFTDASAEAVDRATAEHLRHGTTTLLASLVSADLPELDRQVRALRPLVGSAPGRATVAGLHLEGPFLSDTRRGAHDPHVLCPPQASALDRLLDAGEGTVRMVTLAPELPGGIPAVERLARAGILAAVGHTDASYDVTRAAVDAGARVATHLFNAMRPVHHREPGPVTALLEDERVLVELINDGVHLHPAIARDVVRLAGTGRVTLVTDAMAATGVGDGDYVLGGLPVRVESGVARLVDGGSIAGSTLTMDVAFRRAVQLLGLSLEEAVAITSATPAAALGRDDLGDLAPGRRADLVALSDKLTVTAVMAGGRWVA
ncbi:MAG TPA: N-acetylglucosamine-6-phosphate deacetylase [Segeticoccus sp.]|uniref:N-acetylglucosamine-6-phosphate deacetylase n=1 Tax=Segeticoccus sp. TaxID=2706531 RepID=UPI002D7FA90C|nr:N-acetylglucosamine-6-phosphate deacetylase [Segeticoccus sp.]HET8598708.1 N-acetylglucosamine-6-phosphate deacetylase [Segeticoccus sp.]